MRTTYSGLGSLRTHPIDLIGVIGTYNNVYAFRAKSVAMLHRATIISDQDGCTDQIRDLYATMDITSHLIKAMTSYRATTCPTFSRTRDHENDGHDATLIFAMSMAYAALIQLSNRFVGKDTDLWGRRLGAARACIALGVEVCQADSSLLHGLAHAPWCASYEVLAWEMIRLDALNKAEAAIAIRAELNIAMDLLKLLVRGFNAIKYTPQIKNLSRFDVHAAELAEWSKR